MTEQELISKAMSVLGSRTSKKKAAASRKNGKLGGNRYGRTAGNAHQRRVVRRRFQRKAK